MPHLNSLMVRIPDSVVGNLGRCPLIIRMCLCDNSNNRRVAVLLSVVRWLTLGTCRSMWELSTAATTLAVPSFTSWSQLTQLHTFKMCMSITLCWGATLMDPILSQAHMCYLLMLLHCCQLHLLTHSALGNPTRCLLRHCQQCWPCTICCALHRALSGHYTHAHN